MKIYSTNPLERLNREVQRRTNVVGIFPNEGSILRLVGAMLMEQQDDWIQGKCYLTLGDVSGGVQSDRDTIGRGRATPKSALR